MTILDTFYTLFKSDTTDLEKGLDDARKSSKKTAKDLEATDLAARKMGESIGVAIKQFAGAALAGLALHNVVDAMLQAVTAADSLNEATERLGLNIEEVSAWGDAVKKNGGSVDSFIGSIEALNKGLSQVEVTGKSRLAPFFEELGIDLNSAAFKGKTATEMLLPLADAFEGMSKQKSVAIGQRLGLDQGTIATLQQGRREVEEMIRREKELGVITAQQGKIADDFGDQLDDTRHAFRSLWLEVSTAVVPVLTFFAKKFEEIATFMRENKNFIVGLMIAIGAAVAFFAIPPLLAMAAAAIAALAPFILIAAAVAAVGLAFALAYDDVMNFIEGNDSLIGQIFEKYPLIQTLIYGIGDAFKFVMETTRQGFLLVGQVFMAVGGLITGIIGGWVDAIKTFVSLLGGLPNLFRGIGNFLGIGQSQIGAAGNTPLASQSSNSIVGPSNSSKNTSVKVDNVNVQTQATDAAGISKSIGDSLGAQMRQAANNYDDGVLA